ncbi:MAG: response regulator transcription factor [Pseudonocardia sp.]|nr:response regulator transcription factor [Pseudonocardia sp.]
MQETPVRVLVVDDQRPFRFAAAAVIARMSGYELVGTAETGEDAVAAATGLRPDLVLMDVRLPGITGAEAAARVAEVLPDVVVVLCSTYQRADLPDDLDGRLDELPFRTDYLHKEELRGAVLREIWERLSVRS